MFLHFFVKTLAPTIFCYIKFTYQVLNDIKNQEKIKKRTKIAPKKHQKSNKIRSKIESRIAWDIPYYPRAVLRDFIALLSNYPKRDYPKSIRQQVSNKYQLRPPSG